MTTLTIKLGEPLFSFHSKQQWVNKAQSWYSGLKKDSYITIDAAGRICTHGKHFMRAEDEDTYPITVYLIEPEPQPQPQPQAKE